jgi:hypothetical protein
MPTMAMYESQQLSDTLLLADPRASAAVLTPEESKALLNLPAPATSCVAIAGACLDSKALTCTNGFIKGLCPGTPDHVLCCPTQKPISPDIGKNCTGNFGGPKARCLDRLTTKCATPFVRGKCSGPANVMCCTQPFTDSIGAQKREDELESDAIDAAEERPTTASSAAAVTVSASLVVVVVVVVVVSCII